MSSALQPHTQQHVVVTVDLLPVFVIQRPQLLLNSLQKTGDQFCITRKPHLQGILNNQRDQARGGNAAVNRSFVASGEQIWQPANMIDVNVSNDESLNCS